MEKSNIVSLASYRERKPVIRLIEWPMSVIRQRLFEAFYNGRETLSYFHRRVLLALVSNEHMTFAHVLNVPVSEEIWPGDAAELFFPELYACRLSNDWLYIDTSFLAEHKRCEIQRLCSGGFYGLAYFEYDFFHHMENRSFPDSVYGDDGEQEEDSMDSVLLLTQEYEPPKR